MGHGTLIHFYFSVLELSGNHFFCIQAFLHLRLSQCKFYLGFSSTCFDNIKPVAFWLLVILCDDFNLVS